MRRFVPLVRAGVVAGLVALAPAASAQEIFGIFRNPSLISEGIDLLGVIDPATGAVTTRGDAFDAGSRPGGVSDVDEAAGRFFFVAAQGDASEFSIWTLDVATGAVLDVETIDLTGLQSGPHCLAWDAANDRLLAVMSLDPSGDEVLAELDPATGATTTLGTGFPTNGFSGGVCAFDPAGQTVFFVANPEGESDRALFQIDAATGAVGGAPMLTSGDPAVQTTPGFVAWDPVAMRVVAVVNRNPSTEGKVLVSVDRATGALAAIGDAIPSGGFSSGVSDFDDAGGVLWFLANDPDNLGSNLFGVDETGAAETNVPLTTEEAGLTLSTSFLGFLPAPEPGAAALAAAAIASLGAIGRRRAKARAAYAESP